MVHGVEIVRAWDAAVLRPYMGAERLSEELSFITVRLHVPEGQRASGFHADGSFDDRSVRTVNLTADELGGCDFVLVAK